MPKKPHSVRPDGGFDSIEATKFGSPLVKQGRHSGRQAGKVGVDRHLGMELEHVHNSRHNMLGNLVEGFPRASDVSDMARASDSASTVGAPPHMSKLGRKRRNSTTAQMLIEFKVDKKREPMCWTAVRCLEEIIIRDMSMGLLAGSWALLVISILIWIKDLCYTLFWDELSNTQRITVLVAGCVRGVLIQLWTFILFSFMVPKHVDKELLRNNLLIISFDPAYRIFVWFFNLGVIEGPPLELPLNFLFLSLIVYNSRRMAARLCYSQRKALAIKFGIPIVIPVIIAVIFSHYVLPIYTKSEEWIRQGIVLAVMIVLAIMRGVCGMCMQTLVQLQANRNFVVMSTICAFNSVVIRTLQAGLATVDARVQNALLLGVVEMTGTLFVPYGDFLIYMLKNKTLKIDRSVVEPRRRRVFADVVLMSNKLECASVPLGNGIMFLVRTSYGRENGSILLKEFFVSTLTLLVVESVYEFFTYLWLARMENIPILRNGSRQMLLNTKLLLFVLSMGSLYFASKLFPIVSSTVDITEREVRAFCMDESFPNVTRAHDGFVP